MICLVHIPIPPFLAILIKSTTMTTATAFWKTAPLLNVYHEKSAALVLMLSQATSKATYIVSGDKGPLGPV